MNFLHSLVLLLLAIDTGILAQPVFNHINREQGLSQLNIKAITQDRQGRMWFATGDGVNRYDGYQMKTYQYRPGESSTINDNNVMSLLVGRTGELWVGTLKGLNLYVPASDDFINYPVENRQHLRIFSLFESKEMQLLLGTNGKGLFYLDRKAQKIKPYVLSDDRLLLNKKIKVIREDKYHLFIGTDQGLFIYDKSNKKLSKHRVFSSGEQEDIANDINAIYIKSEHELLIGTYAGLYVFDHKIRQYSTPAQAGKLSKVLSKKVVNAIEEVGDNLWIATDQGIDILSHDLTKIVNISPDETNTGSLSASKVSTLFKDRMGLLWLGTKNEGINLYNPATEQLGLYQIAKHPDRCVNSNGHFNVIKSQVGELWFDVYNKGVYKLNTTTDTCTGFKEISLHILENNDPISAGSLFEHSNGDIWLGTVNGAIFRLKKGNVAFERFYGNNLTKLKGGSLRAIVEDPLGNLWLGFDNAGLRYLNYRTEIFEQFIHHSDDNNSISSNYVFTLTLDNQVLWIGSETGGLDSYDIKTKHFSHYWHEGWDNGFTSSVYSLANDPKGYLWAGTDGQGLARLDKKSGEIRYFTTADGLPNNIIYKLLMDNLGHLWLATNKGLVHFDPKTNSVFNFYHTDGLQGDDFNTGGFFDSQSNNIYLVGDNGMNIFNPQDIVKEPFMPTTIITDFLLFNLPSNQLLTIDPAQRQSVSLEHRQNLFSFVFTGLHYLDPTRQQYQYKMQGFDKNWRIGDANYRVATYTNLDPGEYLFRVKSSSQNGIWGEETLVTIFISPPLWLTWWAKISYIVLTVILLFAAHRYRTRSMRERNVSLEQNIRSRTHELNEEKRRVETLLKNKTKEFENISHEFRTPLAIIIGRTQQQLKGDIQVEQKNAFNLINNIANRLALTVDDVIAMARFSQVEQKMSFKKISISTLLSEICLHMSSYAALKQQRFVTEISPDIFQRCLPGALEKLVNNLISNAIKYTPEKGYISIVLRPSETGQYQIIVKDSGVGIAKQLQKSVFERFFRCDDSELCSPGSGIGLSLVRDVVELHQGQITLNSEPGQGCEFLVTFPYESTLSEIERYTIKPDIINIMMAGEPQVNNVLSEEKQLASPLPSLLLVEDNAQLRALLQEELAGRYQLLCAANGADGLAMAIKLVPQIIISDINMPKMNGYQLLDKVKNHPGTSHIPVILLTAQCDAQSRVTGFKYNADGYIGKPYHLDELLAVLDAQHFNRQKTRDHVTALLANNKPLTDLGLDEYSNEVIDKCVAYVYQHYQETSLSVKALLDIACLSERQLQRKFQEILAMTPGEFIKDHRLKCAQQLLRKAIKVNDVALRVGYSNANPFSRQYKDKFGFAPSQEVKRSA